MMNFGMEQARERLRHVTAACAAAEAGYWEERGANGETGETFSKYKQRILEEKRSLTTEILRTLGLKWVAPSSNGKSSNLLVSRPSRERKQSQLPPLATAGVSFANDQKQQQQQPPPQPHNIRRDSSSEGAWVGPEEVCGPPRKSSPYEAEQRLIVLAAERGRQSAAARTGHGEGGITTGTSKDCEGRRRFSNMENEVPDVAVIRIPGGGGGGGWPVSQRRDNAIDTEHRHPHQQQHSSWRQLKKLDHHHQHHHHPRQTSPLLVTPLPAALVESGGSLPPIADIDGEDWRPFKRARKVSRDEQDRETARTSINLDNPRGSYLPPNSGSPLAVSGSSSRRPSSTSSSSSPSPPPLPHRAGGFYLGPPVVDFNSPAGTTTSCSFSPDSDGYTLSPPHPGMVHEQQRRASGGGGGGGGKDDADAAAAAVHVLGLRNGHGSAAATAAVAATEPAAVVMVGSKRPREVPGQEPALPAAMPAAVNIVRAGGGFAGSTTTMTRHGRGSGGVGRRPSTGSRQSNGAGAAGPAPKGGQACRDVGCHRRPIYAFKGDTKALCCPIHRSEEMVNVRHPLCRHETCFRQPSFGMEGDQRASFCSEHKLPKMINVSSRRCQAAGCLRHPNFGFQGDRRATFCCRHKATGMIDVVSRRCQHPQCVRRPLYAMAGQRAMFCRTHKDPGHTDVVSRRCNFEGGCDRHPSFGWKQADGKARRCAHHRLEGMESVKVNNRRGSAAAAAAALKAKETR